MDLDHRGYVIFSFPYGMTFEIDKTGREVVEEQEEDEENIFRTISAECEIRDEDLETYEGEKRDFYILVNNEWEKKQAFLASGYEDMINAKEYFEKDRGVEDVRVLGPLDIEGR